MTGQTRNPQPRGVEAIEPCHPWFAVRQIKRKRAQFAERCNERIAANFAGTVTISRLLLAEPGQILSDLNISKIRLLSNTPTHVPALEGFGLEIVEQIPIPGEAIGSRK